MSLTLLITPGGHLRTLRDPESQPDVSALTAEAFWTNVIDPKPE